MKRGFYSILLFIALFSFLGHNFYSHQHDELTVFAYNHHDHPHHHEGSKDHHSDNPLPDSESEHALEFGKILFKPQPVLIKLHQIQYSKDVIGIPAFIWVLKPNNESSAVVFKPDKWNLTPGSYTLIADRAPPVI